MNHPPTESDEKCKVCQKPSVHKCSACHAAYYCSKQHQKDDWKQHKTLCRPFKICQDDVLGRHLVATRTIKSGDVILKEAPVVWGPQQESVPVCLGCGKGVSEENSRPCRKCGWPVCGDLCEKAPGHLPECRYTSQRGKVTVKQYGIPHPIYRCIAVLRCLYQKQFLPKVWKKLDGLESHCERRKAVPGEYETDRVAIAEFVRRFFKLESVFSEEEIMRVVGIVKVNSHEVPLTEPPHIAIYGTTSLLEHNCTANCSKSFTNRGQIIISAANQIAEGDHLSISYTDPLWGTPNRRHFLNETKFFSCECPRCQDTTEFGTNFSALKCQNGTCSGLLLPPTFTDTQSLPDWTCSKCPKTITSYSAHDILDRIGKDLFELKKSETSSCKKFMQTYQSSYLSPNHFYLTEVKYTLSQLIGQEKGLADTNSEDLSLKLKLCLDLVKLLRKIAPAEKRTIGLVLFELHAASAEIARRKGLESRDPHEIRHDLNESKKTLLEAVECLKYEPEELPEGKVLKQARQNLRDIDVVLMTIHQQLGDSPM